MKKITTWILAILLFTFASIPLAQATDTKSVSVAIPITTGLVGNNGSAKVFLLDLPTGVTPSALQTTTLKYVGSNETIGGVTLENGKLKVTLKGVSNQKTIEVNGYKSSFNGSFTTNIGNSIWRYSDGRRWQINDYNPANDRMETYDKNATDYGMPSADPPKTLVNAMSDQSTTGRGWYSDTGEKIDEQYVISTTIQPILKSTSSYVKEAKFKNGKIITAHYIGGNNNRWVDKTEEATIPITTNVQGRFYSATVNYYYTATAKLTTYSYGGKITFDYNLPSDATLNGGVTILKPSPNPTKFDGKDVPVQLSLRGELIAYANSSNIEEWVFYAKEKDKESTLQTKKDYSKVLSSNRQFDFIIPKSRIIGDNYKQEYTLTVVARFKSPVTTKSGTITSLQQTFGAIIEVYKTAPSISFPEPASEPAEPKGDPPVARLSAPDTVKAGEEFLASGGGSYDPDGTVEGYLWETTGAKTAASAPNQQNVTLWYPSSEIGQNNIGLTVVDNDLMSDSTGTFVNVIEPKPVAALRIGGTKKQNRAVTIYNESISPKHYPLKDERTKITIRPIIGGTSSDIKYSGPLTGVNIKDVLFRQPGTYEATIYVENTAGYSDSTTITFDIVPDEAPKIYFSMPGTVYRDPQNNNKASISLDDLSFSPDDDILVSRLWEYRYDSDNDGSFEDESWVVFSHGNEDRLNLEVSEVGRYEIRHTATEEFGQPTLDEFVTAGDRRSANSDSQSAAERIVDVKNRGPQGDWAW
ncbi:hypothetical protein J2Z22_001543 [Paenibacillus forsythiae]|uniref:Uncharacterized protein n=1 Tax=Paenibacillus forsythiae TaxID=365616 RepID=A0ABU3H5D0_9BACL|nr:hypothetical protein [Paenibacillus forsythiae]MDT3426023.1 hypothetical protein [Paenibacillus forsythiae]